jgi:hypothetical protein
MAQLLSVKATNESTTTIIGITSYSSSCQSSSFSFSERSDFFEYEYEDEDKFYFGDLYHIDDM